MALGDFDPNIRMLTRDASGTIQFSLLAEYPEVVSSDGSATVVQNPPDATTGRTTYDISVAAVGAGNPVTSFSINAIDGTLVIGTQSGAVFPVLLSDLASALGVGGGGGTTSSFTANFGSGTNLGSHSDGAGTITNVFAPLATLVLQGQNLVFNDGVSGDVTVGTLGGSGVTVQSFQVVGADLVLTMSDATTFPVPLSALNTGGGGGATSAISGTGVGNAIATHADGAGNTVIINESITSLAGDGNGGLIYTNEAGTLQTLLATQLGGETNTTLVSDGNGGFTYTNEVGTPSTITSAQLREEDCYIPALYENAISGGANSYNVNGLDYQNDDTLVHGKIYCGRPTVDSAGGPTTFQLNSVGAASNLPLVMHDGQDIPAGQIQADIIICALYIDPAQATATSPAASHDASFNGWILQDYVEGVTPGSLVAAAGTDAQATNSSGATQGSVTLRSVTIADPGLGAGNTYTVHINTVFGANSCSTLPSPANPGGSVSAFGRLLIDGVLYTERPDGDDTNIPYTLSGRTLPMTVTVASRFAASGSPSCTASVVFEALDYLVFAE